MPPLGWLKSGDQAQQGRLAAARRAQDAQEFAGFDVERDIGERLDAVGEDLGDAANADQRHQAGGKREVEPRRPHRHRQRVARGEIGRQRRAVGDALERQHEAGAHAEHGVAVEVLVVLGEELGDQRLVARRLDDHVQMRRPPGVAAERAQHVAGRAVVRHRVGDRPHGREGEGAVVGHGQARVVVGRRLWPVSCWA